MSKARLVTKLLSWILLVTMSPAICIAVKVPALIVFGDSTVDPGNNNQIDTLLKSDFQPYGRDFFDGIPTGRFSNGRLATDFISEMLGLKPAIPAYLDPSYDIGDFATGVSFASAGTGYDNATSDVLNVVPLWKEVEYFKEYQRRLRDYLGKEKARRTIEEALYLISIGTNDFLENYYLLPWRSSELTVEGFEDFLVEIAAGFIGTLYRLGARRMVLTGLGPMGCLPLERTTNILNGGDCIEEYNNVALDFNAKLEIMVNALGLWGLRLVFSNPYDTLLQAIRNPNSYGFEVASVSCCSTGLFEMGYLCNKYSPFTCDDADKYVFWDSFHPTEKMNSIFANLTVQNVLPMLL